MEWRLIRKSTCYLMLTTRFKNPGNDCLKLHGIYHESNEREDK